MIKNYSVPLIIANLTMYCLEATYKNKNFVKPLQLAIDFYNDKITSFELALKEINTLDSIVFHTAIQSAFNNDSYDKFVMVVEDNTIDVYQKMIDNTTNQ